MINIKIGNKGFPLPDKNIINYLENEDLRVHKMLTVKQFIPNPWLFVLLYTVDKEERLYKIETLKEWVLFANPELPTKVEWLIIENLEITHPQNIKIDYD